MKQQYANIKELTDFEKGLRFAMHRLMELKTIEYEYLKNPYYTEDSEGKESIKEEIETLLQQLIEQE